MPKDASRPSKASKPTHPRTERELLDDIERLSADAQRRVFEHVAEWLGIPLPDPEEERPASDD